VRLLTRNGYDWSHRYPLIVEAAPKNHIASFVLDGEAVLLGVHGISDSTLCIRGNMTTRFSYKPSTSWRLRVMICRSCRCTFGKTISRGY
jgi:hypothetical protein